MSDKFKFVYSYHAEYYVHADTAQEADELFAQLLEHGTYTDDINKAHESIKRLSWPDRKNQEEHVWNFAMNQWEQTKYSLS
jgi:uncharacterized protein Smg (DUF494 family)|tara:strand:+ start:1515 stop:1757 length:243 start_codon:yes stop_codon:yes gene_type:complete